MARREIKEEASGMKDIGASRLLLDCTLRDGGYVNGWEFDRQTVWNVMDGLYRSGVRYIELGIMGRGGVPGKSTRFSDMDQIVPLLERREPDCHYAVMVNQAEAASFRFPQRGEETVDLIRIAFFKKEKAAAMATARELKAKGYQVFLQAMATFMYGPEELDGLIDGVNELEPAGFYMVDSFSTMYGRDVRAMADHMLARISPEVLFGFHAHNNLQLAYSNVIEFFSSGTDRPLIADGSIYGMGRGAGNVPIELLMEYLNKSAGAGYDVMRVLDVFQKDIRPIFRQYYWGYAPEYFLTASKDMNSVYGWYLSEHGVKDLQDFDAILDRLPQEVRYTLDRKAADRAIETYYGGRDT